MNQCGGCTVCCKVMGVVEIQKEPQSLCQHCRKGYGCSIYSGRPPSCADFQCIWLSDELPLDLRPDRSHVLLIVMDDEVGILVKLNAKHPEAHKELRMAEYLRKLVDLGKVILIQIDDELREVYYSTSAIRANHEKAGEILELVRRIDSSARASDQQRNLG